MSVAEGGELLRGSYEAGFARSVGVAAAIWHACLLLPLVEFLPRYRIATVPVLVWLGMLAAGAAAVTRSRRRSLTGREAAGLLATAVVATLAVGASCRGYDVVGFANWAAIGAGWPLALVTASRPAREWVPAGLAVTAVAVGVAVREAGLDPLAVGRLAALVCGLWIMQVSIAAVRAGFRVTARAAAAAVEAELALAAEREVAAAVRADRRRRFRLLQDDTLPLVRGIAAGHLDPRDEDVRRRCAAQAAVLRRTLAGTGGRAAAPGELRLAVEAAESRGVRVEVQAAGDLSRVPPAAREEIVRSVAAVLDDLSSDRVLLTVLGGSEETRVFVSFPIVGVGGRARGPTSAGAGPRRSTEIVEDVEDGRATLEVRWSR